MAAPDFLHGYVLHSRPYRENSRLVDFWLAEQGRVGAVLRGGRGRQAQAQLFQPLLLSLGGQGELKTVKGLESAGHLLPLAGMALMSGFYLNELLMRLLPRDLALPALFLAYVECMGALAETQDVEPWLRRFEKQLLDALGYGFAFERDAQSGEPVISGQHYMFVPERGMLPVLAARQGSFPGELLLACAAQQFEQPEVRRACKRIQREALARLLGGKPLKSRELFLKIS